MLIMEEAVVGHKVKLFWLRILVTFLLGYVSAHILVGVGVTNVSLGNEVIGGNEVTAGRLTTGGPTLTY